jgi:hypothetical protein
LKKEVRRKRKKKEERSSAENSTLFLFPPSFFFFLFSGPFFFGLLAFNLLKVRPPLRLQAAGYRLRAAAQSGAKPRLLRIPTSDFRLPSFCPSALQHSMKIV